LGLKKGPTESERRSPWQKQADGAWKKLGDPTDKGGDNNLCYEDKFAVIWDINSHPSRSRAAWPPAMWAKTSRTGTVGQVDDQYVDRTRYDKEKSPEAGRKSDPRPATRFPAS